VVKKPNTTGNYTGLRVDTVLLGG